MPIEATWIEATWLAVWSRAERCHDLSRLPPSLPSSDGD